jgi:hypothetical protein
MGLNNNLINWDPGAARQTALYNRSGSLYLMQFPKGGSRASAKDSGYWDVGWDWNLIPGTTAIHYDSETLLKKSKRSGGYGDSRAFAGGVSLGANGTYAYRMSNRSQTDF